ncbi:MAG: RNA polymerase sigma factor [Acidimicrobiales bacterium]
MEEPASERAIVERLRAGDELAFQELVRRHHNAMVRFAETFVPSRAIAEEVAQEAWLGVIKGIDRFEGRSALSTWIFRIVANIGRTRGERERRTVATVSLSHELAEAGPRFRRAGSAGRPVEAPGPTRRHTGATFPTNAS